MENEARDGTREVVAESFWGAIAAFFLVQVFGFIVYQGFLYHFFSDTAEGPALMRFVWAGGWILVFLMFQSQILGIIGRFLRSDQKKLILPDARNVDDILKFFLALAFAATFVGFNLGHYPFPMTGDNPLSFGLFLAVSWWVSSMGGSPAKSGGPSVAVGPGMLFGFLVGGVFIVAGVFMDGLFYFHGMIGWGVCTMLLTGWLLRDQIR